MSVAVVAIAASDTLRYLAAIESRLCRLLWECVYVCAPGVTREIQPLPESLGQVRTEMRLVWLR